MFCPKCGTKLEEDTVFCTNCGTKIENNIEWSPGFSEAFQKDASDAVQPEPVNQPTKDAGEEGAADETFYQQKKKFNGKDFFKKNSKTLIGIAAVFIAAFLAVKLFSALFFRSLDSVISVYDQKDKKSTIYLNAKMIDTVDGEAQIFGNMDGSAFYIVDGKYTVYYLKGKKLVKVMKDCSEIRIANHDKTALLIDKDNVLSRYNGSKLEEITDKNVSEIVISGDGNYYAYTILNDDYEYDSYIGKSPDKEVKVKNAKIFAMSEKCDYIYGIDDEDNLLNINKKGDKETLAKDVQHDFMLNEKGTEIIFIMNDKTYISVKGKDKTKVSNGIIMNIYGKKNKSSNVSLYSTSDFTDAMVVRVSNFYPIDTFKKSIAYMKEAGEDNICLLSGKYEAEEIVSDVSLLCKVDEKASKIYYIEDSDLYYVKAKKGAKEEKLAQNIRDAYQVFISDDCEDIYYINEDDELYYIKGTREAKAIDKDLKVNSWNYPTVINGKLYIGIGDKFYYINGSKAKELKKIKGMKYDSMAQKVYAYDNDKLYEVKKGVLKKLKGSFEGIGYIFSG